MTKNINQIIKENCYLYSTWSGKLKVEPGRVMISNDKNDFYGKFIKFKKTTALTCHKEPGKVYNSIVWLPERNDDLAKLILINYHESAIEELKEKIENHLAKIVEIREGLKNED